MNKRHLCSLVVIAVFAACSNKPFHKDTEQALSISIDTSSIVVIESSNSEENMEEESTSFDFPDYLVEAYVIEKRIKCYDGKMQYLSTQSLDKSISRVQVIGKSTIMYPTSKEDAYCSQAYFLKIKLEDGQEFIVDGSQVYGITEESEKHLVEYTNKSYRLFAVTPFTIGSFYDGELSGCDEYNTLILEDGDQKVYHLVVNKRDDYYADKNNLNYFYLRSDDGGVEKLSSAEGGKEYICGHIDSHLQDGRFTYDLHIFERENTFYWEIHNKSDIIFD